MKTVADGQTRVAIVDDHLALRLGVAAVIAAQQNLQLVAHASTVPELLTISTDFNVVLLDLRLRDHSTPRTNLRLLQAIDAKVLCYTSGESPELIREATRAGALGIMLKSDHPRALVEAIGAALRGEPVVDSEWASALDADERLADAGLTRREAEVLRHYASGKSAEQVAKHLSITRATVIEHVRNLRAKYASVDRDAPTKLHLYHRAVEDELLDE